MSKPAFMQLVKNAAPAPKYVTRWRAAKRHSTVQSTASLLPEGLPSKMQIVVPVAKPAICAFHMTQPVELYQW
jgi:hypothetical protein